MHDENIVKLKYLATQLVEFSSFATDNSKDDRCLILYGLTRDCGYKILAEAEKEWKNHALQRKAIGLQHKGKKGKVEL